MTRRTLVLVLESGPVRVLAGIAAAGSFTHIRDTAADHGQRGWMAWAVAVCIDLTCVMAATERRRDQAVRRAPGRVSWPTLVLVGGVVLSLAANLAQADPSPWGWITAATPAGAFLVAVSMLERRANRPAAPSPSREETGRPAPEPMDAPPSFGRPGRPALSSSSDRTGNRCDDPDPPPSSAPSAAPAPRAVGGSADAPLLEFARRVADEHRAAYGRPITRDALRARLGVSNQLTSDLLRRLRADATPEGASGHAER
ncbi:DUF2637 domain-containing protein [Actinomadura atramentaria]|uniref:DUF2637 domain-containing protein n=1 Tax=Actinomadura atramentaria TaxID=1990 RepID=UPI00036C70D9|nr:DUF2637 domain-containing protein [Actinomadura atramentaria]